MQMKDSRIPADWIATQVRNNPITFNPKTGVWRLFGRGAFVNLLLPAKPMDNKQTDKKDTYNIRLLLPPGMEASLQPFYLAWVEECRKNYPNNIGADGIPFGLYEPIEDQGKKTWSKYAGFTPGCYTIQAGTTRKIQVTDTAYNPIVDSQRIYSGAWFVISVNFYKIPVKTNPGMTLGLQNVMVVADDDSLGGTAAPPQDDFAGITIDQTYDPAGQFGATPPGAPPPASVLPAGGWQPTPQQAAPPPGAWRPPSSTAPGAGQPPAFMQQGRPPVAPILNNPPPGHMLPPGVSNEDLWK
jgi:Protein of unknown function (DUF2815)